MPRNYVINSKTRLCRRCLEGFFYKRGYGYFCSTWCKEVYFSDFDHGNKQGYIQGCRCGLCLGGRINNSKGVREFNCEICNNTYLSGTTSKRFCSDKCRSMSTTAKTSVTCDICGILGYRSREKDYPYSCAGCRKLNPKHGRGYYMTSRCRCDVCVESVNTYQRDWVRRRYRETGISYSNGYRKNYEYISTETRLYIFERDGWECLTCKRDLTVENLSIYDDGYPTIDHIVCTSWLDKPDNSVDNLRSLCRKCNITRRDDPEGKELWLLDSRKWELENKILE